MTVGGFDRGGVGPRIAAALGANIAGRVLAIGIQIATPALFLWCWSVELYGEWLVLTALPAALAASDLGFCAAASNDLTIRAAKGDAAGAVAVFQSGLGLVLTASALVTVLVVGVVAGCDVSAMLGLNSIGASEVRVILVVLTLQIALGLPGELLLGGFRGANRFAEGLVIANALTVLDIVGTVGALFCVGTPLAVAIAALAAQGVRLGIMAVLMRRRLGWPGVLRPRFSLADYRRLLPPALGFASVPLARAAGNQGMVILLGLLADPVLVVAFTTSRTAVRLVSTVAGLVVNSISSELSVAWAGEGRALLRALLIGAGQVTLWSGLAAALLLVFGRDVLARLWLHGAVVLPLALLLPLIAAELANALGRVAFIVIAAANRHARTAFGTCLLSFGGLGLAALLIPGAGAVGAGLAVASAEAAILVLTLRTAGRLAGIPPGFLLTRLLVPPFWGVRLPS